MTTDLKEGTEVLVAWTSEGQQDHSTEAVWTAGKNGIKRKEADGELRRTKKAIETARAWLKEADAQGSVFVGGEEEKVEAFRQALHELDSPYPELPMEAK